MKFKISDESILITTLGALMLSGITLMTLGLFKGNKKDKAKH